MKSLKSAFQKYFSPLKSGDRLSHYFAPGRINLIGEHIDYNGGQVLPVAISLGIRALVRTNEHGFIRMASMQEKGGLIFDTQNPNFEKSAVQWANYPLGVIKELYEQGIRLHGADILIDSNLPVGSGLSSSAALEVLTAFIALSKSKQAINRTKLSLLCQKAENEFIGVQCGIMDQFAIANGKSKHAILLNCDDLRYEHIPFDTKQYSLLILNTKKGRTLADSKYNERCEECAAALDLIQQKHEVQHLCQAELKALLQLKQHAVFYQRARHAITEQQRVKEASKQLQKGNIKGFGYLMTDSHNSLKADYEVSGFELDTFVDLALQHKACIGARMTGAGFGGCAIALVETKKVNHFKTVVEEQYYQQTGLHGEVYVAEISDGVKQL